MNEEMRNENIETEEIVNPVAETCVDETTESGGGLLKFVAVAVCAAGAAGAYLYKTKNKRQARKKNRMIEKLEAEGYTVSMNKPEVVDVEEVSEDVWETEE